MGKLLRVDDADKSQVQHGRGRLMATGKQTRITNVKEDAIIKWTTETSNNQGIIMTECFHASRTNKHIMALRLMCFDRVTNVKWSEIDIEYATNMLNVEPNAIVVADTPLSGFLE